ncbi:HNH endonuclease [Desulfuromonas thiophila]|uniref:HNH endonuclease n=1 Tax=Desulfuromonas thiophila TaxID=57664 RepID=UPI0038992F0A
MPTSPARPCRRCRRPTRNAGGYCDRCEPRRKQAANEQDRRRGSAAARGYGHRWRKLRAAFLAEHPLCAECQRRGRVTVATDVDHIEPHKGDKGKFWALGNLQALCHRCHSVKTAREDGGFGNG